MLGMSYIKVYYRKTTPLQKNSGCSNPQHGSHRSLQTTRVKAIGVYLVATRVAVGYRDVPAHVVCTQRILQTRLCTEVGFPNPDKHGFADLISS